MMMGDGLPGMTLDGFEAAELARWHDGLAGAALRQGDHEQHDLHEARAAQLRRWARSWAGTAKVTLDLGA